MLKYGDHIEPQQLNLAFENYNYKKSNYLGVTFQLNKDEIVHRWYPYIEGFSQDFVSSTLADHNVTEGIVFDPFAGCGTTPLTASLYGLNSMVTELNPFMQFVCDVKINVVRKLAENFDKEANIFKGLITELGKYDDSSISNLTESEIKNIISPLFYDFNYFSPNVLKKIAFLKAQINKLCKDLPELKKICLLALASILVKVSNLKRAPDLRFKHHPTSDAPVFELLNTKLMGMYYDIEKLVGHKIGKVTIVGDDAKNISAKMKDDSVEIIITSPPYLNGTNYIRNTKLELWILDFIKESKDLRKLREKAITSGINDTYLNGNSRVIFSDIEKVVKEIEKNAYDRRIPVMVGYYFDDMYKALKQMYRVLKSGRDCVIVIGDSAFGGIHVSTDKFLAQICEKVGFTITSFDIARKRRSHGGLPLQETIIVARKER